MISNSCGRSIHVLHRESEYTNDGFCGHFPVIDLHKCTGEATKAQKLKRFARLFRLAPKYIRCRLRRVVSETSIGELSQIVQLAAALSRQLCSHAAYAAMLEPDLTLTFAVALSKTPTQYHDLIFSVLLQPHNQSDHIWLFLREIERIGWFDAVIAALENESFSIFGMKNDYSATNPSSPYVREFLLWLSENHEDPKIQAFTANYMPVFAINRTECLKLIGRYTQSNDLKLKSIGALQFSRLFPESPEVIPLLWRTAELHAAEFRDSVYKSELGHLGGLILKQIMALAYKPLTAEQRAEVLHRANDWCERHMTSTDPVNREVVEHNIIRLYRAANCTPPAVLWFNNPEQAALAAGLHAQATNLFLNRERAAHFSGVQRYIRNLRTVMVPFVDYVKEPHNLNSVNSDFPATNRNTISCVSLMRGYSTRWQEGQYWNELALRRGPLSHDVDVSRFDMIISKLRAAYATKTGTSIHLLEPDSITLKDLELNVFWDVIFDHLRLGLAAFRSFLQWLGACPLEDDGLEAILGNCGGFIPFDDIAIAVERPSKVYRNERNFLHNPNGLSIEYENGCGIYAIDGVTVPSRFITHPETITLKDIVIEPNVEIRRMLIDRFGAARFVAESKASVIDESEYGILYKQEERWRRFAMVRVINRSPEPDGSFREYFLEVPPEMMTARQAVAWTFEMEEFEYQPQVET